MKKDNTVLQSTTQETKH